MSCKHCFCKICWESYLTTKIQDGDAHNILCPAYQCHILVPVEFIEKLVSPDMARRYLQFDIKVRHSSLAINFMQKFMIILNRPSLKATRALNGVLSLAVEEQFVFQKLNKCLEEVSVRKYR